MLCRVPADPQLQRELKAFGHNLRRLRLARSLTQEKLAELVDLNIRTLQRIEAGQTNVLVTTLFRFQRALDCSCDELVPKRR